MKPIILIMCSAIAFAACTSKLKKENEALRNDIDQRRQALTEKVAHELEDARRELASTDSLLELASAEHDSLHQWVMSHATSLNDQSEPVRRLNQLRQRRDSLQVEFEKQAHKVKFYLRK